MNPASAAVLCLSAALALNPAQPTSSQPPQQHPPTAGHPVVPRPATDWPKAKTEDVKSVDAIIGAFYTLSGGAAGETRDWDRYRSLFLPQARLIAARPGAGGAAGAMILGIDEYVSSNRKYFEKGGFFDSEIGRRTDAYGQIAHVWSVYESRHAKEAPEPYSRGINSIELLKDGDRWWIVSVFWDFERPDNPIPPEYLKNK
jgi:hypothetical protein